MFYDSEFAFVQAFLKNSRIPYLLVTDPDAQLSHIDLGLRQVLGLEMEYKKLTSFLEQQIKSQKIYRIVDGFSWNYFFLLLPETEMPTTFIVGPFLTQIPERAALLELSEKFSVPPQSFSSFEKYFSCVPLISDDSALLTLLHTFAEKLWGDSNHFSLESFSHGIVDQYIPPTFNPQIWEQEDTSFSMQTLETRYAIENELLQAVSLGQIHKAEVIIGNMTAGAVEQRTSDSLRNLKNYAIIINTLLRKAAEQGSVHPYHIDKISSDYAKKIEMTTSLEACQKLHKEMIRKYCLLVKNHSMKGYSLLVQKVITYIDSDLTADLSLNAVATMLNVNPSYLSSQFKKETGSTLTDYVNRKKVEHAILLLNSTPLQIQTIAQHCGIPDVNYFTKIFKKYIRKTPKEYRDGIM